ncbi:hypothetical protein [Sulfitobacter sp. PS-8MA]|uniref:hypothetical protein n=1 Tax=Sulfitobacter sp. PS-8MA TaxID=3237707 RepID=UPI0034C63743
MAKSTLISALLTVAALTACAKTSVTPISNNQFLLSASAAPACGKAGAARVASQMAAVETIRRGYPRYVVLGANSENNVSVINRSPTYAATTSNYSVYGNQIYGNSTTSFGGGGPMVIGSRDADLRVLMLKPGEQGFEQGIDAKQTLGANWAEIVKKGVKPCTE